MALAALLSMLGVQSEADGITLVSSFNTFLSDARAATGATDMNSALAAIQSNSTLARQLESVTGKSGQEAVNTAIAWKSQAESASNLAKQLADIEAARAVQERDQLIAELSTDGGPEKPAKLPPALHAWAKTQTKAQLEAWAKDAPPFIGSQANPAPAAATNGANTVTPPAANTQSLSAEELDVCRLLAMDPAAFLERKQFEATNTANPHAVNVGARS